MWWLSGRVWCLPLLAARSGAGAAGSSVFESVGTEYNKASGATTLGEVLHSQLPLALRHVNFDTWSVTVGHGMVRCLPSGRLPVQIPL